MAVQKSDLQALFDLSVDLLCVAGFDGRFLDLNPAWEALLGYSVEELKSRPFVDFVHPEDRDRTIREAGQLQTNASVTLEFRNRYRHKEGHYRWLSWNARSSLREGRIYAVARDITDQVEFQKHAAGEDGPASEGDDVTRSVRLMEYSINRAGESFFWVNKEARIVEVNEAATRSLGYSRQKLLSMTVHDLDPAFPPSRWAGHWSDLKRHRTLRFESGHLTHDGRLLPVEIMANYLQFEGREYNCAIVRDISERKDAEQRLQTVLESAPIVLFALDRTGRVTLAEGRGMDRLGLRPGDVVGRMTVEVFPDIPGLDDDIRRALQGESFSSVTKLRSRVFELRYTTLRDGAGRPDGVLGIGVDITEQHSAELQLKEKDELLDRAQRLEPLGRLAAGVAHDFNNLLTVINGFSQVVLDKLPKESELWTEVAEIKEAGRRGADLTRQLLAFSRKSAKVPERVDLNDVVAGIEKMLQRLIDSRVRLVTELGTDLEPILIDAGGLEQVLVNLVVNAQDAITKSGTITIRTAKAGSEVLLEVVDDGTGMDKATMARVFDPFFTTKKKGRGTGLGLATVKSIVDGAEGCIELDSEPGKGTTIRIRFQAVAAESKRAAKTPIADAGISGRGRAILVAEDSEVIRRLTREILSGRGFRVLEARDGVEALEVFEQYGKEISLLLTDSDMPRLDGIELARRLREASPELRILFMSGYDEESLRGVAATVGGAILEKPFSISTLLGAIGRSFDVPAR